MVKNLLVHPRLEGKDIASFLIAPLQRLARYKLLIDAILKLITQLNQDHDVYSMGLDLSNYLDNVKRIYLSFLF